ncbi:3-oxoacyl-[acyl-carrier-protein] synthase II [Rhodopseudomonas julia]|uniref:3-oxoacyl-[acyl-carrier-protein] synthase 2 n=1 Tax=Rhodopseudomonas julia TaxID=200617 RepID=A0ABU0CBG7_9BRAD|nr:beta-ketoacyl-ACP synthase II [Rhodopseudomonas julia]MDQ0326960.1 3-oxoacyl-[acyl-carrier-protein] synthase II [Rhodopseudomonas julia]
MNPNKRVVVTGLGVVSPLGCGVDLVWSRLIEARSGIRALPDDVVPDIPSKIGGVVPSLSDDAEGGFEPTRVVPEKDLKKMDRFIQMAMVAAEEALGQADWHPEDEGERERTGTVIGSGVGGFPAMRAAADLTTARGARRLSPFLVPSFLVNLAAGQVSIRHHFRGPIGAPVTACAASVQAIGDAARLIRDGEADVILAGGAEACIDRVSLGGFAAARALSTHFNETPEKASRPFDRDHDGFVMGEGAAMLVLETLEHAEARGATPIAEVLGYGTTADAYHLTAGPEDGAGNRRAMAIALRQAGIEPSAVGYLNAHATSTPVGDAGELAGVRSVFGDHKVAISSTKSATGHLLGAAGGLEAVFTILALRDGILPPTLNLENPMEGAEGLDLIGPEAREQKVDVAMSNGFGFGGVNASVVLKRWN